MDRYQEKQVSSSPAQSDYLQWHPAFYASLQIELQEEAKYLTFENEHQLGTKPKEIDVLVIKKAEHIQIRKNIGRIFRKHNIFEYKRPSDTLSINDYYRTLGYACFYKADTVQEDAIRYNEITLTFVCTRYPQKLLRHLLQERHFTLRKVQDGIYYLDGEVFPIQLLWTKELSFTENLWLRSLTDNLSVSEIRDFLMPVYSQHDNNILYQSAMNILVRANKDHFEEANGMCDALLELFHDQLEARRLAAIEEGLAEGHAQGRVQGMQVKLVELVCRKLKKQKTPEVIADELEEDLATIQNICEAASRFAPDYDCMKILETLSA